ncbi:MAG TPA: hypothetical protein VF533_08410 [Solirubrobacteraceae bacterium]|jgi:hypothetical protein
MSRVLVLVAVALAGLAGPAHAATRHGVTPVSPRAGDTIPRGEAPLFKVRARGGGEVYVHVCRSKKKRRADGLICTRESVGRATRGKGGVYRYRPRFHDFPGFWLNRPGVYYWQAHRIKCVRRRTKDCRQEGPTLKLRVK